MKVIASLVRKAKKNLLQGKREEALELMRKAVIVDDNNGVLVQLIQAIGRKKLITESENQPLITPEIPAAEQAEPEPVQALEESWVVEEEAEEEPVEALEESWVVEEEAEEEPVEALEESWVVEEKSEQKPEPETKAMGNSQERTTSMPSEDQLTKMFEASDREFDNGNQQKSIAYLKKARKLYPDNPEITSRIDLLKIRIKSANLIQIARKRLVLGETTRAISLARQAFSMRPDSAGLDELLSELESMTGLSSSASDISDVKETEPGFSYEYITRIRQLVQDNSLEEAASVAEEAFDNYPDDKLVLEFVDNFKKLGLLE